MHGFTEKIYENRRMVCEDNVMYERLNSDRPTRCHLLYYFIIYLLLNMF